jgi:hypothetical protein
MKIRFTKAPTFTKGIIAAALFAIVYLASTSNLPSCSDTVAVLNSGGECIERQSFLHTASGWLALVCLVAAVLLLALKHKDAIMGRLGSVQQAHQGPSAQAPEMSRMSQAPQAPQASSAPWAPPEPVPAPVPGRASNFCAKCGTRIIAGDRFCQGCGVPVGPVYS